MTKINSFDFMTEDGFCNITINYDGNMFIINDDRSYWRYAHIVTFNTYVECLNYVAHSMGYDTIDEGITDNNKMCHFILPEENMTNVCGFTVKTGMVYATMDNGQECFIGGTFDDYHSCDEDVLLVVYYLKNNKWEVDFVSSDNFNDSPFVVEYFKNLQTCKSIDKDIIDGSEYEPIDRDSTDEVASFYMPSSQGPYDGYIIERPNRYEPTLYRIRHDYIHYYDEGLETIGYFYGLSHAINYVCFIADKKRSELFKYFERHQ